MADSLPGSGMNVGVTGPVGLPSAPPEPMVQEPLETPPVPAAGPDLSAPGPRQPYTPQPGENWTPVWNPEGELVEVPASQMTWGAKVAGYREATPEEVAQYKLEQKYSGVGQGAAAFGEGTVESLFPWVGPKVLQAFGDKPEEMRGRAQARAGLNVAGQITGAVGPLLATMGASAPASAAATAAETAAKFTAPALIAKAGEALGATVGKSTALARLTAASANFAAQNALYAGSDIVNRAALQQPQLTGEQILTEIGVSSLLGAGLGGSAAGLGELATGSGFDLIKTVEALETRGALKAAGGIKGTIKKATQKMGDERLGEIARYWGDQGWVSPLKNFKDMIEIGQEGRQTAWGDMESILQQANQNGVSQVNIRDITDAVRGSPEYQELARDFTQKDALSEVNKALDSADNQYAIRNPNGEIIGWQTIPVDELHKISQRFGNGARGWQGSLDPMKKPVTEILDDARWQANNVLDQELDRVGQQSGVGARAWKDAKFRYQAAKTLEDFATEGAFRSAGNNQIALTEIMAGLSGMIHGGLGPGAAIAGGAALVRRKGASIQNLAFRHLGDFLQGLSVNGTKAISSGVRAVFQGGLGVAGAQLGASAAGYEHLTADNYNDRSQQWNAYMTNPDQIAQKVEENLGPVVASAPPVALQVHQAASRQVAFLAGAAPVYPKLSPLEPDYVPSGTELAKANDALEIAHRPTAVLDRIADGTLTNAYLQAAQTMWPAQMAAMKQALGDEMGKRVGKGEPIPYRTRVGLSLFLGQPLDRWATPKAVFASQMAYAAQPPPPPPAPMPQPAPSQRPRSVQIDQANRLGTVSQNASSRLEKS